MLRTVAQALPYIIAGLFGLALLLFLISLQQLRRGRTGSYWRLRRDAGQRGGQLFLLSVALFGIAMALAIFSGLADLAYQRIKSALENSNPDAVHGIALSTPTYPVFMTNTPTATVTPTLTLSPTPQPETATPTITISPIPSDMPPASLTPTITATASATFESILFLVPPTSAVQPLANARIDLTAAALDIAADGSPSNAGDQFPANTKRVFFFFDYANMTPGVTWTRILYREGIPIQGQSYEWSLPSSGTGYFFFGSQDGYPAGNYEVRLFLGDSQISNLVFTLSG